MLPVNGDGRRGAVSSLQHGLPHGHLHKRNVLVHLRGAQGALHDSVALCETRSASSNGGREQTPQAFLPLDATGFRTSMKLKRSARRARPPAMRSAKESTRNSMCGRSGPPEK